MGNKNLRRLRCLVTAQTMGNLERLAAMDGCGDVGRMVDKLTREKMLSLIFLKGYQWPFDNRRAADGSSVIDLLVYRETVLSGRRVYLDYTKNPFGLENIEFDRLSAEAYTYLEKAGACFGTPYERLMKMNAPAVELYRSKGVDLSRERLEIALCAQHNNGGIAVDMWWQTCVPGLFAAGGIFMYSNSLSSENIFKYQSEAIREIASRTSCIIVGRCADYVLEQTGVPHLSIFITAPFEDRVSREMERQNLSEKEATAQVKKMDKQRKSYYSYYTNRSWGDPHDYDLCINSSSYGIDKTADLLTLFVRSLEDGHFTKK